LLILNQKLRVYFRVIYLFCSNNLQGFPGHLEDHFLSAFDSPCPDDIADHHAIIGDADSVAICVVFHDVVEESLQVEEDGEGLGGNTVDIVVLFEAVFLDVVGSVDGQAFVVVRDVAGLPRDQVQPDQKVAGFALEVLERGVLVH
jgi:hypothetical protein